MRPFLGVLGLGGLVVAASFAVAQPPDNGPPGDRPPARDAADGFIVRMMAFDRDADGRLSKEEVSDERLTRLFERADADQDGVLTKKELTTLEETEREVYGRGGFGGGPRGLGGPGGELRRGPGGPTGPPRPGEVLPPPVRDLLELTEDQRGQIDELQKEVDARLEKILTEDQLQRLKQAQEFGPGRRGRPPGPPPGRPGRPSQ